MTPPSTPTAATTPHLGKLARRNVDGVLRGVVPPGVVEDQPHVRHESACVVVLHRVQRLRHRSENARKLEKIRKISTRTTPILHGYCYTCRKMCILSKAGQVNSYRFSISICVHLLYTEAKKYKIAIGK